MDNNNFNRNNLYAGNRGNNAIMSVKFRSNEKDILLRRPKSVLTSKNCIDYNRDLRDLVHSKGYWHQIIVSNLFVN